VFGELLLDGVALLALLSAEAEALLLGLTLLL
jgi:hypothetical protein